MILLLGDVHTQWDHLLFQVQKASEMFDLEAIVQAGDMGIFPDCWGDFPSLDLPVYFIEGNHEVFPLLRKISKGSKEMVEVKPGVFYIPRGASFELGGLKWVGLGGCRMFSDFNCPPGSVFKEEEIKRAVSKGKVDVVLTHDGPVGLEIPGNPDFGGGFDVGAPQLLPLYELNPKVWIFAHHHRLVEVKRLKGCDHYGLHCCSEGFAVLEPETLRVAWKSNSCPDHEYDI